MRKFMLKRAEYRQGQAVRLPLLLLTVLSLSSGTSSAWANQTKLANDNQTIKATVSARELTRVFVTGDRIYQVRGLDGAYELEQDEEHGAVYLKPTPAFHDTTFSLFITTEAGRTYSLRLTPKEAPAESIELVPLEAKKSEAARWEAANAYEETLVALLSAMVRGTVPEGYAKAPLSSASALATQAIPLGLELTPVHSYRGAHLVGEVWRVTHQGNRPVRLEASAFTTPQTRAVGLLEAVLSPRQTTLVYWVVNHD